MPREFLHVTKEATAGTFDTLAAAADKFPIRLDRANAFNALDKPINWNIRDAAGSNRPIQTGNEQVASTGTLSTILYPTQQAVLVGWACNIVGDPLEQGTVTFDHVRMLEDPANTIVYRRYVGCKCQTFKLAATNSGDGVVVRTDYTFMHMGESVITVADRATPALSTYPSIKPYVFQDLAGNLILGGARTNFASAEINVNNIVFPFFDESRYPSRLSWRGRDVSASIKFRMKDQTDRTAMLAASAQTMEILFDSGVTPAAYSLKFDFHDSVRTLTVEEDRPLDAGFYQTVGATGYLDLTAGTDLAVTSIGPI